MEGDGDVRIAGKFKGDIHIKGNLNIQKGAHLTAKIDAEAITIEGESRRNGRCQRAGHAFGIRTVRRRSQSKNIYRGCAGSRMRGNVEFGWNESEAVKFANGRAHESGKSTSENKPASLANFRFTGALFQYAVGTY